MPNWHGLALTCNVFELPGPLLDHYFVCVSVSCLLLRLASCHGQSTSNEKLQGPFSTKSARISYHHNKDQDVNKLIIWRKETQSEIVWNYSLEQKIFRHLIEDYFNLRTMSWKWLQKMHKNLVDHWELCIVLFQTVIVMFTTCHHLKTECMADWPRVEKFPIEIQFLATCYCHGYQ